MARKELVTVGLDPEDADILRKHAEAKYRSLSEIIRMIAKEYIKQSNLKQIYSK